MFLPLFVKEPARSSKTEETSYGERELERLEDIEVCDPKREKGIIEKSQTENLREQ